LAGIFLWGASIRENPEQTHLKTFTDLIDKEVVAIGGKTIRGAKSKGEKSPVHTVSA